MIVNPDLKDLRNTSRFLKNFLTDGDQSDSFHRNSLIKFFPSIISLEEMIDRPRSDKAQRPYDGPQCTNYCTHKSRANVKFYFWLQLLLKLGGLSRSYKLERKR